MPNGVLVPAVICRPCLIAEVDAILMYVYALDSQDLQMRKPTVQSTVFNLVKQSTAVRSSIRRDAKKCSFLEVRQYTQAWSNIKLTLVTSRSRTRLNRVWRYPGCSPMPTGCGTTPDCHRDGRQMPAEEHRTISRVGLRASLGR